MNTLESVWGTVGLIYRLSPNIEKLHRGSSLIDFLMSRCSFYRERENGREVREVLLRLGQVVYITTISLLKYGKLVSDHTGHHRCGSFLHSGVHKYRNDLSKEVLRYGAQIKRTYFICGRR